LENDPTLQHQHQSTLYRSQYSRQHNLPSTFTAAAMSSSRLWQIVGGATVLGGGYYLYNAGGSPKAAEKRFEGLSTLHIPLVPHPRDYRQSAD